MAIDLEYVERRLYGLEHNVSYLERQVDKLSESLLKQRMELEGFSAHVESLSK